MRSSLAQLLALAMAIALGGCATTSSPSEPPPLALEPLAESPQDVPQDEEPLLIGDDGFFDVSKFLDSKTGFLPVIIPITEPAVGYGFGAAAAFFHTRPQVLQTAKGPRIVPPTATIVGGMATENGTWAGFAGHLHTWDSGRVRYMAAAGYGALNLDWFGEDDAFGGQAFSYNMEMWAELQKLTMKIGDSDFFWGVEQRYLATNARFDGDPGQPPPGGGLGIPAGELDSTVSGLGLVGAYDTRDSLFSPTQGHKISLIAMGNDEVIGSDFDYTTSQLEDCFYLPLTEAWVLGLRGDAQYASEDAPFFDLASINLRGIQAGRYVDNAVLTLESELRWDLTQRWTLVGFGGVGAAADDFGELGASHNRWAGGTGFRYLIAKEYGMRLGMDVARGPEQYALYLTVGTGWVRD
jgi:hypothetical protein